MSRTPGIFAAAIAVALAWPVPVVSRSSSGTDDAKRIQQSLQLLRDLTAQPDDRIPAYLLERAEAIVVIPALVRVGSGADDRHGQGVASARWSRSGDGLPSWSPPAFVELTGGLVGWQIGARSADLVLLLMHSDSVRRLVENRLTLGKHLSMAAGPVGRSASVPTDLGPDRDVYAYSRSKGFFAGATLEGVLVRADDDAIESFYGRETGMHQLLVDQASTMRAPMIVSTWIATLRDLTGWPATPRYPLAQADRPLPPGSVDDRQPPLAGLAPPPGFNGKLVSLTDLVKHPKDFYGRQVMLTGWVEDVYSGTMFAIDDDRLLTTGRGVLVVAPSLRRTITDQLDVAIAGDLLKFDKGDIEKRARGYRFDLSDQFIDHFDDQPVILAMSIKTRDGQELLDGRVNR